MNGQASFGWVLLVGGLVLAGLGLVWLSWPSLPLPGRLPGDIRVEGQRGTFY